MADHPIPDSDEIRYSRQVLFEGIGAEGQERLGTARVAIVGCGALGSFHATLLARAGVGTLRLIDRDFVEFSNLQRQILFDEEDARRILPKAGAAQQKLQRVNSRIRIDAEIEDLNPGNAHRLLSDVDLILDGSDNFEVRLLVNDFSIARSVPWIYGACVGSYGLTFTIIPGETPCLRCLFESAPPPGSVPTCDTAGVLGSIVSVISGLQTAEALKLLAGRREALNLGLQSVDVWEGRLQTISLGPGSRRNDCPACGRKEFEHLEGGMESNAVTLCGRESVQVRPLNAGQVDLEAMEKKLAPLGGVERNRYLLRARIDPYLITLFTDGRAIITGTRDEAVARSVYARYIGH